MKEQSQNPFIVEFQNELINTKNQEFLIQNEIAQIEFFTSTSNQKNKLDILGVKDNTTNSVFDLSNIGSKKRFNKVYYDYQINGESEFSDGEESYPYLKTIHEQAKLFAEYYIWLKELLAVPSKKRNKVEITLHQKMLLLYYLGFDPNKNKKTESAEILFLILGLDKNKDNLRKSLSLLVAGKNKVRTKENLNFVKQLFEKHNLIEISNTIQKELEMFK